eukprot:gnl/TRDRNA2_/TRDRNA2_163527_c0_seq3.p1 gnl/TRDRNA2_/TRDRNA2_163527_c0~~gnl/TRDRNA2_/TRDRNA2_163527_c0_seq3.p1  ORF type:complete len:1207 (-),score=158.21 gnl/TRDRNA2_/TRDRNA2_163527_c0_seq3:98-3535(-)
MATEEATTQCAASLSTGDSDESETDEGCCLGSDYMCANDGTSSASTDVAFDISALQRPVSPGVVGKVILPTAFADTPLLPMRPTQELPSTDAQSAPTCAVVPPQAKMHAPEQVQSTAEQLGAAVSAQALPADGQQELDLRLSQVEIPASPGRLKRDPLPVVPQLSADVPLAETPLSSSRESLVPPFTHAQLVAALASTTSSRSWSRAFSSRGTLPASPGGLDRPCLPVVPTLAEVPLAETPLCTSRQSSAPPPVEAAVLEVSQPDDAVGDSHQLDNNSCRKDGIAAPSCSSGPIAAAESAAPIPLDSSRVETLAVSDTGEAAPGMPDRAALPDAPAHLLAPTGSHTVQTCSESQTVLPLAGVECTEQDSSLPDSESSSMPNALARTELTHVKTVQSISMWSSDLSLNPDKAELPISSGQHERLAVDCKPSPPEAPMEEVSPGISQASCAVEVSSASCWNTAPPLVAQRLAEKLTGSCSWLAPLQLESNVDVSPRSCAVVASSLGAVGDASDDGSLETGGIAVSMRTSEESRPPHTSSDKQGSAASSDKEPHASGPRPVVAAAGRPPLPAGEEIWRPPELQVSTDVAPVHAFAAPSRWTGCGGTGAPMAQVVLPSTDVYWQATGVPPSDVCDVQSTAAEAAELRRDAAVPRPPSSHRCERSSSPANSKLCERISARSESACDLRAVRVFSAQPVAGTSMKNEQLAMRRRLPTQLDSNRPNACIQRSLALSATRVPVRNPSQAACSATLPQESPPVRTIRETSVPASLLLPSAGGAVARVSSAAPTKAAAHTSSVPCPDAAAPAASAAASRTSCSPLPRRQHGRGSPTAASIPFLIPVLRTSTGAAGANGAAGVNPSRLGLARPQQQQHHPQQVVDANAHQSSTPHLGSGYPASNQESATGRDEVSRPVAATSQRLRSPHQALDERQRPGSPTRASSRERPQGTPAVMVWPMYQRVPSYAPPATFSYVPSASHAPSPKNSTTASYTPAPTPAASCMAAPPPANLPATAAAGPTSAPPRPTVSSSPTAPAAQALGVGEKSRCPSPSPGRSGTNAGRDGTASQPRPLLPSAAPARSCAVGAAAAANNAAMPGVAAPLLLQRATVPWPPPQRSPTRSAAPVSSAGQGGGNAKRARPWGSPPPALLPRPKA